MIAELVPEYSGQIDTAEFPIPPEAKPSFTVVRPFTERHSGSRIEGGSRPPGAGVPT